MSQHPNILCFVTDQQRADHLGCYGNPDLQTPHLDRLAREGIRFDSSFVANPVCMPNRATMFTGRYPKAHGLRENGVPLSPDEVLLPQVLRQAGYRTGSFGKIHLAPFCILPDTPAEPRERLESFPYWEKNDSVPMPFHGFDHLYFVGGHGPGAFGHYKNELDRDHPGSHALMGREHALRPPSGARESWASALPEELHYNTRVAEETCRFLEQCPGDQPFFAWCSFPDPHHPFSPPAPYCDQYDPDALTFDPARREGEIDRLPPFFRECREGRCPTGGLFGDVRETTDAHFREILAHTYGMISMVDHNIGKVLGALEDQGRLDDTIIVFFSDHGDLMGDHGLINKGPFLFRGLVRVPTLWRLPGAANAGSVTDALVSTVDLCPTLLDWAGVDAPPGVQGRSYRGVLTGDDTAFRDAVYIEYDETYLDDRLRQIRTRDWALTYFAANDYGQLYDLRNDPDELDNRWDDPACQQAKQDLLHTLLRQTSAADDWLPPRKCHA